MPQLRGPTAAGAADADSLGTLAGLLGPAALLALLLLALGGTLLHVGGREPSMDSALHYLADIRCVPLPTPTHNHPRAMHCTHQAA